MVDQSAADWVLEEAGLLSDCRSLQAVYVVSVRLLQ